MKQGLKRLRSHLLETKKKKRKKKAPSLRPNPRTSRYLWTQILLRAAWALWVLLTPSSLCPQAHVTSHSSLIHAKCRHNFLVLLLCRICSRWKSDGSQLGQVLSGTAPGPTSLGMVPRSLPSTLRFIRNKLTSC